MIAYAPDCARCGHLNHAIGGACPCECHTQTLCVAMSPFIQRPCIRWDNHKGGHQDAAGNTWPTSET